MRAASRFLAGLGVLALVGAGAAAAQRPQTREGFWIGFGFGYGSADASCETILGSPCGNADRQRGVTGFLKLGGTLSPNLLLGGAVNAWTKEDQGITETLGNVTASVYFYPAPANGFFLTGGLGFSSYQASDGGTIDGNGWGFTAGLGYDIRVGRNVSLTPNVNFVYGAVGDIEKGAAATGWKQNIFDVGLGVTFH